VWPCVVEGFVGAVIPAIGRGVLKSTAVRVKGTTDELDDVPISRQQLCGAWSLGFDLDEGHKAMMVTLQSSGTFSTAKGSTEPLEGQWSVDEDTREVTVAVYGVAKTIKSWFVGTVDISGDSVTGFVGDGGIDPEWVGNFTLTKFMPSFEREATIKRSQKPKKPVFKHSDFYGHWRFHGLRYSTPPPPSPREDGQKSGWDSEDGDDGESSSLGSPLLFSLVLYPNSTWETTAGFGDHALLAGRWNVFEEKLDLGTGINGTGSKLWIAAKRFGPLGGQVSRGVAMNSDTLYLGSVQPADNGIDGSAGGEAPDLRVSGFIAHGFQNEPVFTGRFNMTRSLLSASGEADELGEDSGGKVGKGSE